MKLDALDHPKTINFAAELGVCLPQAIGHLELLWVFVGQKTPRGNIGRWSNAVIAYHAQWTGSPDHFVNSLIAAGFVDEDEEHRLLIHDWEDHMPRWVKAKLAREKKTVISRDSSEQHSTDVSNDVSGDCSSDCSGYSVSEGKGSEGKGREKPLSGSAAPDVREDLFDKARKHDTLSPNDNRQTALKAWKARVREGVDPQRLASQWIAYRDTCDGDRRHIKHQATFYGPDRHWELDYTPRGKVPDDIDELRTLVVERQIELPDNCTLKQARIEVSRQTGMSL